MTNAVLVPCQQSLVECKYVIVADSVYVCKKFGTVKTLLEV